MSHAVVTHRNDVRALIGACRDADGSVARETRSTACSDAGSFRGGTGDTVPLTSASSFKIKTDEDVEAVRTACVVPSKRTKMIQQRAKVG